MVPTINVFVTGATGYIGGTVLGRLLEHENTRSFRFTALVRSEDKAAKLRSLGVNTIIGSHDDADKVEDAASKSDLVLSMADADHLGSARAILRGLKKRHEAYGAVPLLIHTSGTGVLTDKAGGKFSYDTVYNDADPDQIETLAPTQPHRNVDLEILAADKAGYVKTYIILPATIYGLATGKVVDLGIQNRHSVQIPALIKACLDRGHAGMVGEGKNLWPNVDIDDLAELYVTLVNSVMSNPETPHGREGFYFGENGEHSLFQISEEIGKVLVDLGKAQSAEPKTFTKEEITKYFGTDWLGTNSRCKAERSRKIGWKPVKTTKDMLASIRPEIEALARK